MHFSCEDKLEASTIPHKNIKASQWRNWIKRWAVVFLSFLDTHIGGDWEIIIITTRIRQDMEKTALDS